MNRLIAAIALMLAVPVTANAEMPSTQYTFTSDDVYNVLNPIQKSELDTLQEDLRELQATGRSLPEGSASRQAVLAAFEAKKAEREEKFGFIRGINGTTITVWGEATPSIDDILGPVFHGRTGGYGDGILYPHYYFDENARLVGSNSPPPEVNETDSAGPDLSASGLVVTGDMLESTRCDESSYLFGTSTLECRDDD